MTQPMQFQDKFNSLATSVGITEDELLMAKFFWYAGLRHAFQRGTSQAALLQPKPPIDKPDENQYGFARNFPYAAPHAPEPKNSDLQLSSHEAKLVSLIITQVLSNSQEGIRLFENSTNSMWKYCDKDNKESEEIFKEMNRSKVRLRRLKSQLNTLTNAQRKLKKITKGT